MIYASNRSARLTSPDELVGLRCSETLSSRLGRGPRKGWTGPSIRGAAWLWRGGAVWTHGAHVCRHVFPLAHPRYLEPSQPLLPLVYFCLSQPRSRGKNAFLLFLPHLRVIHSRTRLWELKGECGYNLEAACWRCPWSQGEIVPTSQALGPGRPGSSSRCVIPWLCDVNLRIRLKLSVPRFPHI